MVIAYIALALSSCRLIYKLLDSIVMFLNYKKKLRLTKSHEACQYLVNTGAHEACSNIIYQTEMKNGVCRQSKCPGYYPVSKPMSIRSFADIVISTFPELATLLLSLNEIIQ